MSSSTEITDSLRALFEAWEAVATPEKVAEFNCDSCQSSIDFFSIKENTLEVIKIPQNSQRFTEKFGVGQSESV